MIFTRTLWLSILIAAFAGAATGPAMAQACTRQGVDVTYDDGRRGICAGDAIVWADGTRWRLASVIIGNKSSVVIGPGGTRRARGIGEAWCRWEIRAHLTRRAAQSWMACRTAFLIPAAFSDANPRPFRLKTRWLVVPRSTVGDGA